MIGLFLPERRTQQEGYGPTADFWYGPVGRQTSSGIAITDEEALTYSAVWACTRLLSATAGRLPLNLYRRGANRGKAVAIGDVRDRLVFRRPNSYSTPMLFKSQGFIHQINGGNAYAEIQWDGDGVTPFAFWPIHNSRVRPVIDEDTDDLYYRVRNNSGEHIDIHSRNMLHFPSMISEDGICGKGVIRNAKESIGMGIATERHGASTFGHGGIPRVVIEAGLKKWTPESRQNFRKEWKEIYGGPDGERVGVIDEGAKLHVMNIDHEALQFLTTRQHNVEEIARWYGVPPHKIQHLLRATFCLPGDAVVFTEHGPKPISQVEIGEVVWSRSENGEWVKSSVSASSCTGIDDVLIIRAGIRTLRCNGNHRVPVRRKFLEPTSGGRGRSIVVDGKKFRASYRTEWVQAKDIRVGDQLLAAHGFGESGVRSCPTRGECSVEFMEALGMIVGDGFFARQTTIGISHGEYDSYLPHYVAAIESEFSACDGPYGLRNGGTVALKSKKRDKNTTVFYSSLAYRELEELGIAGTAKTKTIPAWMFGLATDLKLAFLRGYLDADGTVNKSGQIRYVSVNRKMLEQVRHLCISAGIRVGNLFSAEIDSEFSGKKYQHTLHSFVVTSPADCERIGTHTDFYRERTGRAVAKASVRRNCKVYPYEAKRRATEDGIAYTAVESIHVEPVAVPVYDLTVDGTHTFVADGVLVHNSNIEHQSIEFITDSLMPWLVIWEEELDRKLLSDDEQNEMFFAFNANEYMRGDTVARGQYWHSMVNSGIANRNEARIEEDMNPVDGGDTFLVQGAMVPLDEEGRPVYAEKDAATETPASDNPPDDEDDDEEDEEEDEPPDDEPPGNDAAARAIAVDVLRVTMEETLSRMIRKEVTAARRAANKPGEFLKWMDEFYAKHQEQTAEALAFAENAAVKLSIAFSAEAAAEQLCEQSKAAMLQAAETTADKFAAAIERLASEWETHRAAETVRTFFESERADQ